MRILETVEINVIQEHLKSTKSVVRLDLLNLPGRLEEYKGFRIHLDADDVKKLVLLWEFQEYTIKNSCRVVDIFPSAAFLKRVMNFREIDLRTTDNLDLVIFSNNLQSDFLYILDGNNRAMAQRLFYDDFKNVSAFLCVHPSLLKWMLIPMYYKNLWKL